jgi:hypothetical protein
VTSPGRATLGRVLRRARALAVALAVLAGLAVDPAFAARNLPNDARYGKLTEFAYPYAKIGGKVLHMSPGAKIYNQQNLIILPAAMRAPANVLFKLDTTGQLSAIWILTAQEAAAYSRGPLKPAPAPARTPQTRQPAPADANAAGTNPAGRQ